MQTLGDSAELLPTVSPETWFDQLARGPEGEGGQPADLIAFVGLGERIAAQRWIARAAAALPDTQVVVALIDASIEHAAAVVNQGARGLLALPAGAERIAFQLREMVETAAQSQAKRRAAAKHRKSLATLTAAEVDVLDGMLDGLANKQVAHNLSIGLRTVELRRSKIMKKMGASSLAQLVSFVCAARPVSC
ncbi:MAG: LuxR C-terminal-related transcriptional regulator [Planctomycetota bacterium]